MSISFHEKNLENKTVQTPNFWTIEQWSPIPCCFKLFPF